MKEVGKVNDPGTRGVFLTDGDINLAVLNFKSDAAAGVERGKRFSGIHHIGFQVESLEAIAEKLTHAGRVVVMTLSKRWESGRARRATSR